MHEEQNAIELKQKLHLEEYRKERAGLTHLSWRQRKSALYRANKNKFAARPSERTQREDPSLPLIVKGRTSGSYRRQAASGVRRLTAASGVRRLAASGG